METKKITIAVVAAVALLVVFGFFLMKNQATDFEEDLTNGDELKEDLIPIQEENLNEEQKMALAKISTDCAVQCSYEITYALSFGAKQGVVDGYPRVNSGWCTTKANLHLSGSSPVKRTAPGSHLLKPRQPRQAGSGSPGKSRCSSRLLAHQVPR